MEEENGYELDTLWKIHQGVGDFPGIKVIHLLVGGVSRLMKMVKSIQMKTVHHTKTWNWKLNVMASNDLDKRTVENKCVKVVLSSRFGVRWAMQRPCCCKCFVHLNL
ncbi:hypothetical protein M8J75_002180 [Diaphorina citri]|nr:hypothetical protein M8J75_002180 [Diaphorina citri]